jgi:17beta-estradiol 17-dehydrogenase / very-long-chain 3-oxoacyl-CoA reductase
MLGSTSGIGKEYAEYLSKLGMSVLLISRSEDKLKEQANELKKDFGATIRYVPFDYTDMGEARTAFYKKLDVECASMDNDGGIGLLINNVGIANQYPQRLQELSDKEVSDMINCNIDSTVFMSRVVLKYMETRDKGAIVNVSSGSGNIPSPYISVYSATK